jgi:hypothetical protein
MTRVASSTALVLIVACGSPATATPPPSPRMAGPLGDTWTRQSADGFASAALTAHFLPHSQATIQERGGCGNGCTDACRSPAANVSPQ